VPLGRRLHSGRVGPLPVRPGCARRRGTRWCDPASHRGTASPPDTVDHGARGERRAMTDRAVTRAATRIGIGAFAVLVLISAAQIYALRRALDESISILSALGYGVGTFIVWAMAVPLVVYLGG